MCVHVRACVRACVCVGAFVHGYARAYVRACLRACVRACDANESRNGVAERVLSRGAIYVWTS